MGNDEHSHYDGHPVAKFVDSQAVGLEDALPPANLGPPGVLTYRKPLKPGFLSELFESITEIVCPILILCLGAFSSAIALWVNFK